MECRRSCMLQTRRCIEWIPDEWHNKHVKSTHLLEILDRFAKVEFQGKIDRRPANNWSIDRSSPAHNIDIDHLVEISMR